MKPVGLMPCRSISRDAAAPTSRPTMPNIQPMGMSAMEGRCSLTPEIIRPLTFSCQTFLGPVRHQSGPAAPGPDRVDSMLRSVILAAAGSDRIERLVETAPVSRGMIRRYVAGSAVGDA